MCSKLYNGRILHRVHDITKSDVAHTLSQQGDDFVLFSVSDMSKLSKEFLETAESENHFIQWYDNHLK